MAYESFRDHILLDLDDILRRLPLRHFLLEVHLLAAGHQGHPVGQGNILVVPSDEAAHGVDQSVFDGLGDGHWEFGPDVLDGGVEPPDGLDLLDQGVVLQDDDLESPQHPEFLQELDAFGEGQEDDRDDTQDLLAAGGGLDQLSIDQEYIGHELLVKGEAELGVVIDELAHEAQDLDHGELDFLALGVVLDHLAELIEELHERPHEIVVLDHVVAVAILAHLAHERKGAVLLVAGFEQGGRDGHRLLDAAGLQVLQNLLNSVFGAASRGAGSLSLLRLTLFGGPIATSFHCYAYFDSLNTDYKSADPVDS